MKKILIALDYDPAAQKVAETGFLLAKSLEAEVILLHVIKDSATYDTPGHSPIMGYTGYVDVSPTVLQSAEEVHADIIVLGSHSQKWLENILVGSVTENVINDSSKPLLIVPTKNHA